jgi:alpha-beta hydrolase superfamily lysophospholipase
MRISSKRLTHTVALCAALVVAGALAGTVVASADQQGAPRHVLAAPVVESVLDSEAPLVEGDPTPTEVLELLAHDRHTEGELDKVYTLNHFITVGTARKVHVVEKFTLRSWLRYPRRSVLLLPGTIVKASFYDIDVGGYDFQSALARQGFFTFASEFEGSGLSSYPADGHSVTHQFLVDESRRVLEGVRLLRFVPRVDVLGESNGGAVASEICDDAIRTRTCVMSSMLYRTGTPFFNTVFLDPNFVLFLQGQPHGYLTVTPSSYFNILQDTPPAVANAIVTKQPGIYAVGPLLAPANGLPWFDPTRARVPGLVIQGTVDDIATQPDGDELRAAYGQHGGATAELVRIAGAGHIPRIENPPANEEYRKTVFQFLNAH